MARRTERDKLATLLRKIADNIDLLTESQATWITKIIQNHFITGCAMNQQTHKGKEIIVEKKPGPKIPQTPYLNNYLTPDTPQEIILVLAIMLHEIKERNYKYLPQLTLGLKEKGFIPINIKKTYIYRALIDLAPGATQEEKENIFGNLKEFSRKLKEYELMAFSKDPNEKAKLELTKKLNAKMITEALQN